MHGKMSLRKVRKRYLHGTKVGNGWEKCSEPISNKEVFWKDITNKLIEDVIGFMPENDAPEQCSACGGAKYVLGRLVLVGQVGHNTYQNMQYLRCRDCGVNSHRPIENGITLTRQEKMEEF